MIGSWQVLAEVEAALGATGVGDLVFWTDTELLNYADEAVEHLGRVAGVFVARDPRMTSVGEGVLPLGAQHFSTLHVSYDGAALRPLTVDEADALDSGWTAKTGTPKYWLRDARGLSTLVLYPAPDAAKEVDEIYHTHPTVQAWQSFAAPDVALDYLFYAVLADARGRDSQASMPEVAQHATNMIESWKKLFQGYFGGVE